MEQVSVVTGAGPVGWTVAAQLAASGERVRVLTRSGSGPEHPQIERRRVDVSRPGALAEALDGATAVFHCIHGSAYRAKAWERELPAAEERMLRAAGEAGAVVVFPESLYSYTATDAPMVEAGPRDAAGGKRGIRTGLLAAREASATATVSVVASDFFGPRVTMAQAGERMVPSVLSGTSIRVFGALDEPHSFTYVPDLAAAMVTAARDDALWNSVLHAPTGPALTQRQLVTALADAATVQVPRLGVLPGWLFRAGGLVSTDLRELAEMLYQFDRPFVMDSAHSQRLLGLEPTPLAEAAAATVQWWSGSARLTSGGIRPRY